MIKYDSKPSVKGICDPFGSGFFGKMKDKQENLYNQKKDDLIVPLEEMARTLITITDEQWCEYAFSREPINSILTDVERKEFSEKALRCADEYVEKYKTLGNPIRIAEQLGIHVAYLERPTAKAMEANRVLFARYTTPGNIEIFTDCTERAEEAFFSDDMRKILGNVSIKDVLLCHELFHHFEELDEKTIYTENARKVRKVFNVIPNDARIVCLGEIAAMRFAKGFLNLSYSPYVFDVLLAYLYDRQVACNLYAKIQRMLGLETIKIEKNFNN